MQNVMQKAWEIAREGQRKFGGSLKEYFAEVLRMAWSIVKKGMGKMKDIVLKSDFREWKNYGKHRLYIDVEMSLVEVKEVKGQEVGAKRGIVAQYYYDLKEEKMFVQNYREKDLSRADADVAKYMKDEVKKAAFDIVEKFKVRMGM